MTSITREEARELLGRPKRNKFGAKKVTLDGHRFDSQREALRYATLKLLVKSGDYRDLVLQPRYPLMVGTAKIADYVADFAYVDTTTGEEITEDVKGMQTPVFRLKRKHFEAQYGRKIRITK